MLGQGKIYGARWVIPLQPGKGLFHSIVLGVDYKNFKDDLILAGSNTGHTPISYMPFSVGYNANMPDKEGLKNTRLEPKR